MNIKELRELIKDLDDSMPVVIADDIEGIYFIPNTVECQERWRCIHEELWLNEHYEDEVQEKVFVVCST